MWCRPGVFKCWSWWPRPPSASLHHNSLLPSLFPQRLADWCSRGDQLVVGSLQVHELVVGSLLYHDAPGHDGDDVGVLDSGQAMGDNNAGATLPGFVQGVLHCLSSKTHTDRRKPSPFPPQRLYNYSNFTVVHWLLSLKCFRGSVRCWALFVLSMVQHFIIFKRLYQRVAVTDRWW